MKMWNSFAGSVRGTNLEFTIDAKNKPQKVGAFMVELKSTNLNKKRYSVSLIIDDVHIDKKNLPVNEPVFFHQGKRSPPVGNGRQPGWARIK